MTIINNDKTSADITGNCLIKASKVISVVIGDLITSIGKAYQSLSLQDEDEINELKDLCNTVIEVLKQLRLDFHKEDGFTAKVNKLSDQGVSILGSYKVLCDEIDLALERAEGIPTLALEQSSSDDPEYKEDVMGLLNTKVKAFIDYRIIEFIHKPNSFPSEDEAKLIVDIQETVEGAYSKLKDKLSLWVH